MKSFQKRHCLIDEGTAVSQKDLDYLVAVRAALREALRANHEDAPLSAEAQAVMNSAIEAAEVAPVLERTGHRLVAHATGIERTVGLLVVEMLEAMADGTWGRLKICFNDACQWAFYDRSPARSGKWCSMSICGNRTKQQAWRERRS